MYRRDRPDSGWVLRDKYLETWVRSFGSVYLTVERGLLVGDGSYADQRYVWRVRAARFGHSYPHRGAFDTLRGAKAAATKLGRQLDALPVER